MVRDYNKLAQEAWDWDLQELILLDSMVGCGATCHYTQETRVLDLLVLVFGWGRRGLVGSWGGVGGEGGIPFG